MERVTLPPGDIDHDDLPGIRVRDEQPLPILGRNGGHRAGIAGGLPELAFQGPALTCCSPSTVVFHLRERSGPFPQRLPAHHRSGQSPA